MKKRDFAGEIKTELERALRGETIVSPCTGNEAAEAARAMVNVRISKEAFAQISKLAKKRKKGVAGGPDRMGGTDRRPQAAICARSVSTLSKTVDNPSCVILH